MSITKLIVCAGVGVIAYNHADQIQTLANTGLDYAVTHAKATFAGVSLTTVFAVAKTWATINS